MNKVGYIKFTVPTMFLQDIDFYVVYKKNYNQSKMIKEIANKYGDEVADVVDGNNKFGATTSYLDGSNGHRRYLVIIYPFDNRIVFQDVVSHEIAHVSTGIFTHVGCGVDSFTEEPYAYLVGYITRKFYENYYKLTSRKRGK